MNKVKIYPYPAPPAGTKFLPAASNTLPVIYNSRSTTDCYGFLFSFPNAGDFFPGPKTSDGYEFLFRFAGPKGSRPGTEGSRLWEKNIRGLTMERKVKTSALCCAG
jgi:hypothetical protein